MKTSEWNKDLSVGLTGAYLCTKYFGSYMNEYYGGAIVNISSDLGLIAPNQELYKEDNFDLKKEAQKAQKIKNKTKNNKSKKEIKKDN